MNVPRATLAFLFLVTTCSAPGVAQEPHGQPVQDEPGRRTTVGVSQTLREVRLPGGELVARPLEDGAALVVRVLRTFPHGTDHRYDLEYYALEPGTFDLTTALVRADGSPAEDLPAVEVQVDPVLAPGQVLPNPLERRDLPRLGGYRTLWITALVLWAIGLVAILLVGRSRRQARAAEDAHRPRTLAERLRPLVEDVRLGRCDPARTAALERLLVAHWRGRLGLREERADRALATLRRHPEAGPLLQQLERWLHRPGESSQVDVERLLEPYAHARDDEDAAGRS